ncbi:hypothetical protein B1756_08195 [Natrarchaeobaculum aegyptiacum]|uniref:Uncharacterized protein n=2 Tax=Natrarchaeobaculum aegyptiacum TaxID=745377 RepID=A0A2Z2HRN3_9EURY|nr:hypothetical protein B1756_08195 [Natrarchaeobaculum aegyptiacum]
MRRTYSGRFWTPDGRFFDGGETFVYRAPEENSMNSRHEQPLEWLTDGTVTFSRAADHAGLSHWEFAALVDDYGRPWVSSTHLESDLEEL